ncbi:MAG: saccharopine dehydrogenase NADP-binding domain-containing protein [Chitinophagales bacterium]|nr:saccharopine dehydrogenase NADP-binding domain-containing protein [Chitinophagales bacterium]
MNLSDRKYDIIVYGSTGFTGKLVAEYLAENVDFSKIKWAIAGRNEYKLFQLKNQLVVQYPQLRNLDIILADTQNEESLEALAQSTKIVITTVGPYILYGEPIVKACVANGTHCVDLVGEPDYVHDIYKHYNFPAERSGSMIINSCGFDSVPADLGAFYTAQLLGKGNDKLIEGYVTVKGNISGGTLASAIGMFEKVDERFLLDLPYRFGPAKAKNIHYQKSIKKWALPMPVIDSLIVSRSSRERKDIYGENFSYAQYFGFRRPLTIGKAIFGVGAIVLASKVDILKNKILQSKPSGQGPSVEERKKSYFELNFIGTSGKKTVITKVSGGDPGYTETSKMLSEAAIVIIENLSDFKNSGGVKTPAGALGEKYLHRLIEKGIHFEQIR